jgi:hypothetical protein
VSERGRCRAGVKLTVNFKRLSFLSFLTPKLFALCHKLLQKLREMVLRTGRNMVSPPEGEKYDKNNATKNRMKKKTEKNIRKGTK